MSNDKYAILDHEGKLVELCDEMPTAEDVTIVLESTLPEKCPRCESFKTRDFGVGGLQECTNCNEIW